MVGNGAGAATLEVTLGGLALESDGPVQVGVAGVEPRVKVNGREVAARNVLSLVAGDRLEIGVAAAGVYSYLSVAGGIDVEPVLGSRSTDTLSGLGPAVVSAGDVLPIGGSEQTQAQESPGHTSAGELGWPVPVLPGPHLDRVGSGTYEVLVAASWRVAATTDRTAALLDGEAIAADVGDLDSEGLFPGAVQLPPDGRPIVFLANHPATGGYPVIGVVPLSDLATIAQTRPGGAVRLIAAKHH